MAPAKVLGDVAKTTSLKLMGGIFEGAVVDQEKVVALSKLPSKKELLGMVVGTAVMGKPAPVPVEGDSLNGFRADLLQSEIDEFLANPKGPLAATLLADATTQHTLLNNEVRRRHRNEPQLAMPKPLFKIDRTVFFVTRRAHRALAAS